MDRNATICSHGNAIQIFSANWWSLSLGLNVLNFPCTSLMIGISNSKWYRVTHRKYTRFISLFDSGYITSNKFMRCVYLYFSRFTSLPRVAYILAPNGRRIVRKCLTDHYLTSAGYGRNEDFLITCGITFCNRLAMRIRLRILLLQLFPAMIDFVKSYNFRLLWNNTVKPVCNDHLYNKVIACHLFSNVV